MRTSNYSFNSSGLISIMVLGSYSSTPISRRCLVFLHLRYRVGGTSTYKSEGYSVRRVSGMIQVDKRKQESNDKDLER